MERVDEVAAASDNSDIELVIQSFHEEIDAYKAAMPTTMNDNCTDLICFYHNDQQLTSPAEKIVFLQIHLYTLELCACQTFLFDKNGSVNFPFIPTKKEALEPGPLREPRNHSELSLAPSQISLLGRGLAAAKDVLDLFLAQSPEVDARLNYMQWLQSGSNIVLACKLAVTASNYASQNSHIKTLCSTLDMPQMLRDLLKRMHFLNACQEEIDWKPPTRSFYVQWIERICTWFEQRYQSSHLEQPSVSETVPVGTDSSLRLSSSWDTTPVYDEYDGDMPQNSGVGEWPDFIWNVTMEDIFSAPMDGENGIPFGMNETWI